MASEHLPGSACAACLHPEDEPLADRLPQSFVSIFAGALLGYRLVRHKAQPIAGSEATIVLESMNLGGTETVITHPVVPAPNCPIGCTASRQRFSAR